MGETHLGGAEMRTSGEGVAISLERSFSRFLVFCWTVAVLLGTTVPALASCWDPDKGHCYPRIGLFKFGGATPEWWAKFDQIVTNQADDHHVDTVKHLDPTTRYLDSVIVWNTFRGVSIPDDWYVRDAEGAVVLIYGGRKMVDISDFCPRSGEMGNKRYNEYLAEYMMDSVDLSKVDGMATHGVRDFPRAEDVDLDRNGVNDWDEHGREWLRETWLVGVHKVVEDLRGSIGADKLALARKRS